MGDNVVATAESSSSPPASRRDVLSFSMSEWREWDWPPYPERHRASRRTTQPILDLHINVRGARSEYRPRRTLYDRFLAGYLRLLIAAARIGIGAALGVAVVVAIWFVVTVIRLL